MTDNFDPTLGARGAVDGIFDASVVLTLEQLDALTPEQRQLYDAQHPPVDFQDAKDVGDDLPPAA